MRDKRERADGDQHGMAARKIAISLSFWCRWSDGAEQVFLSLTNNHQRDNLHWWPQLVRHSVLVKKRACTHWTIPSIYLLNKYSKNADDLLWWIFRGGNCFSRHAPCISTAIVPGQPLFVCKKFLCWSSLAKFQSWHCQLRPLLVRKSGIQKTWKIGNSNNRDPKKKVVSFHFLRCESK